MAPVGGAGIIILGLLSWLGRIWAERIYIRTRARYDKEIEELKNRYNTELERLRGEIAERRDFVNILVSALSSGYSSLHERIVGSIESLWNKVLEVREFASGFLFVYAILVPQEYENLDISQIERMLRHMTEEEFSIQLEDMSKGIGKKRPFIGETLWGMFSVYFAFAMRLVWKVVRERSAGRLYEWTKDVDGTYDQYLRKVQL